MGLAHARPNWGEPERAPHRRVCCEFSIYLFRGATALLVAAMQPRLRLVVYVAQAKYCNSFQLTHMPRGNHAQSIASNGDQKEDKTLLQHSQLSQHGEFRHASVSERQRSWPCGQNLRVPFLRTVLPPEVEESAQRRDKSAHISTTNVSFSTNFLRSGQYKIAITAV